MKTKVDSYVKRLNLVSVEAALFIFRSCFDFLAFSFEDLSADEVEIWIKQLNNAELEKIWMRQKAMKTPSSILHFVVWHFRDKVLQQQEYVREVVEKAKIAQVNSAKVVELLDPLNRELDKFSVFEGLEFVGNIIGAWMLSCPKVSIIDATDTLLYAKPNQIWMQSVFPATLASDESVLLHRLDFWLQEALKSWKPTITY